MSPHTLLSLGVAVFLLGIVLRLLGWLSQSVEPIDKKISPSRRFTAALKGVVATFLSGSKLLALFKTLLVDIVFAQRLFLNNFGRWLGHGLILSGFVGLLLIHGLGNGVSTTLFTDFDITLSPYLLLRNLFGVMVLVGIGMSVVRRLTMRKKRMQTNKADWLALFLVGMIMVSGFLLEGVKMSSYAVFTQMVEEYGAVAGEYENRALEAYWISGNALYSPHKDELQDAKLISDGKVVNDYSCIICHTSNKEAFLSYPIAKVTGKLSSGIDQAVLISLFTYLHFLFITLFIGWLPFGKMFHILAVPLSLFIKGVGYTQQKELLETASMVGLSSCTHCSACTIECSSAMYSVFADNELILPSEKVQLLQKVAAGRKLSQLQMKRLQDGLYICTSCDRCTNICPSGINLKELFVSARYLLLDQGEAEPQMRSHFSFPLVFAKQFAGNHLQALRKVEELFAKSFPKLSDIISPLLVKKTEVESNKSYTSCYSCQKCTNICPVVRGYEEPSEVLGLLPHQIIFSLGTGNLELATGAQMIWSCSTCYLCQEHCPNGVELCDIFYGLKNRAMTQLAVGGGA